MQQPDAKQRIAATASVVHKLTCRRSDITLLPAPTLDHPHPALSHLVWEGAQEDTAALRRRPCSLLLACRQAVRTSHRPHRQHASGSGPHGAAAAVSAALTACACGCCGSGRGQQAGQGGQGTAALRHCLLPQQQQHVKRVEQWHKRRHPQLTCRLRRGCRNAARCVAVGGGGGG